MRTATGRRPPAAVTLILLALLTACGGGDPLPAAGPAPAEATPARPAPAPSGSPAPPLAPSPEAPERTLRLNGVAVLDPFRLEVARKAEPEGDRYDFDIDALNWRVVFEFDTARLSVPPTEANLTSDFLVADGGLTLKTLEVNGARLGTTGTAQGGFDPCTRTFDPDDADERNRQGLVWGRLSRLDSVAAGRFEVMGTDERCNRLTGTIELSAPVR